MPASPVESTRRRIRWRWLGPMALLALVPKCALCVLGYVGLGAALGLGGPELCGAATGAPDVWVAGLAWSGGGLAAVVAARRLRAGR